MWEIIAISAKIPFSKDPAPGPLIDIVLVDKIGVSFRFLIKAALQRPFAFWSSRAAVQPAAGRLRLSSPLHPFPLFRSTKAGSS